MNHMGHAMNTLVGRGPGVVEPLSLCSRRSRIGRRPDCDCRAEAASFLDSVVDRYS